MPSARKLIAVPPTIWSARSWMAKKAWTSASSAAGGHRDQEAEVPVAGLVGAPDAEEGARQHHPLEADVHDAAPLGEHAAERRERERRGVAQRRGDQRRPDDDVREVGAARARCEEPERDPEDPARDGAPAHPPLAARGGPDPGRDGEDPERDRPEDGERRLEGRQRQPEGERAEQDAEDSHGTRLAEAGPVETEPGHGRRGHLAAFCPRRAPSGRAARVSSGPARRR